jgi:hypothetical protein
VLAGIFPPIVCAWIVLISGDCGLFERSGSITAAIGLLAASRRYVHHSIIALVMFRASEVPKSDATEMLKDILTAKLGLALSGFGTFIWVGAHTLVGGASATLWSGRFSSFAVPIGTTFIYRTAKLPRLSPRLFKGDEPRRIARRRLLKASTPQCGVLHSCTFLEAACPSIQLS